MLVKRASRFWTIFFLSGRGKGNRKRERKRRKKRERVTGVTGESRPSLRDVSVAPGARLRRQRVHMGFAERSSGGWRAVRCPTTSWRMGTSVSAPPTPPWLETKTPPLSPFRSLSTFEHGTVSRCQSFASSSIMWRSRPVCVTNKEICYARISRSEGYNLTRNTTSINAYVEH